MARIRSIKPEFWGDLSLASQTSRDARLLYIALWNQADEHGRLHGDRRWIKGHCLPYDDDLSLADVDRLLAELVNAGKVVAYEVRNERFLYLPKLAEHQRLEPHKVASRHPAPPDATPSEPGADEPAPRADESEKKDALHVAGSREHVAGSRDGADKPRTARRTRIPDDFEPTRDMRLWAAENTPDVDVDAQTEQFRDFHTGKGSLQADWPATWRTWMRNAVRFQARAPNYRASPQDETDAFFARAAARAAAKEARGA